VIIHLWNSSVLWTYRLYMWVTVMSVCVLCSRHIGGILRAAVQRHDITIERHYTSRIRIWKFPHFNAIFTRSIPATWRRGLCLVSPMTSLHVMSIISGRFHDCEVLRKYRNPITNILVMTVQKVFLKARRNTVVMRIWHDKNNKNVGRNLRNTRLASSNEHLRDQIQVSEMLVRWS